MVVRIALISDLHSSLVPLDAVLADIDRTGVDRTLCLGDIIDLGPQPSETIARLRERQIDCIAGNHDPLDELPDSPLLRAVEDWTRERMSADELAWLAALPPSLRVDVEGTDLLCVHGSPRSVVEPLTETTSAVDIEAIAEATPFDVLACGHTHVQLVRRYKTRTIVNCGSVSLPFEEQFSGRPPTVMRWAEYALVTFTGSRVSVELRQVDFDFDALMKSFEGIGFPQLETWKLQWASF